MSEQEKFIERWSRRKREATDPSAPTAAKETAAPPATASGEPEEVAELVFDPASLPSIESITAESDIRAFLKPGVPPALTRAALRRAWSADPEIRDFIGLVENGWNFNDPVGVPGFGPMPAGEDIGRLLTQAIGAPSPADTEASRQVASTQDNTDRNASQPMGSEQSPQLTPTNRLNAAQSENELAQRSEVDAALQNISDDGEDVPPSRPRGHGGALPK